jgi:hypothetical protein
VSRRALLPVVRAQSAGESRETDANPTPQNEPSAANPADAAAFAAQLMGQGGQKRGLRGGPETLDHARHAYLETEWSGDADRRHARGKIAKREV